jgi:hypothetical protein
MLVKHLALVSQTKKVSADALMRGAAALQKQAIRDFGPIWNVSATVDAFGKLKDVPLGYWPVIIQDDIHQSGAAGIHLDQGGQPYALVEYSPDWVLTASHEVLEMLADPFGNRLVAGQSPKPKQGRVEFLVEVCDPSEAAEFGYTVNGLLVSDFYTPKYFDPLANSGTRYSYTGAIKKPRQVLKGGYLSWHEPKSDHWFQATWFSGSKVSFVDLGKFTGKMGLRAWIDSHTPTVITSPSPTKGAKPAHTMLVAMAVAAPVTADTEPYEAEQAAWAERLMAEIAEVKKGSEK